MIKDVFFFVFPYILLCVQQLAMLQEEAISLELELFNKSNVQPSRRSSNRGAVYAGSPEPKSSMDSLSNVRGFSPMGGMIPRQSTSRYPDVI